MSLPGIPLLTTKLFVPRVRPDVVVRPRLLTRLAQAQEGCRCTLLSAQAGAGKTTLLAAWLAEREHPTAWLSLDEGDQDVHRFVRYLVAAFQRVAPGCGTTALTWLDAPAADIEAVLTTLVNDVAALPDGTVLVLDDYHLVRSAAVHDATGFFLGHLPPSTHLVISTREDPPLPIARLRGRGQLCELRAADFGFTVDEASDLLAHGMGLPLSREHVAAIVTRTEGWAAGLQLAGLALRSRTDIAEFVTAFAGSHRLVADYLAAEVLDRQPANLRRFLLATSVLDRMCAPLCDAVRDDAGSQRVLEELERVNLFLVPLDDERVWFRYHHLFAQVLRARLAAEDDTATTAAHRRAAAWFGSAGLLPEAVDHALAAGDTDDAAARIEAVVPMMLADYAIDRAMVGWLEALPAATVRTRPMLCLARAWHAIHAPRIDEASGWLAAAEQATPGGDGGQRLRGATAALRALTSVFRPGTTPAAAQALAERALADLPAADAGFRVAAGVVLGQAALASRAPERAEDAISTATTTARGAGLRQPTLIAWSHLAAVQRLRGAHRDALASVRSALAWAAERGAVAGQGPAILSAQLVSLLLEADDLPAARPMAAEALRAVHGLAHMQLPSLLSRLVVVRFRLADGDPHGAMDLLDEARAALSPAIWIQQLVTAADATIRTALGDTAAAARWASSVPELQLPSPLGLQTHLVGAAVEAFGVAPARVLVGHGLATGDLGALRGAAERVEHIRELGRAYGLGALEREARLLEALAADALGNRPAALAALTAAVAACAPEGVVRPFVDAGAPMATLLRAARDDAAEGSEAARRLDGLLAACAPAPPAPLPRNGLVEVLTAREHEVLRLVADGRSNAEIARRLFVEQSTVKTHLVHVYRKLEVRSRTQALVRARDLRLVD
jgi:LuxR family transcriptional regulator, maltose regulon positive regulatory protein